MEMKNQNKIKKEKIFRIVNYYQQCKLRERERSYHTEVKYSDEVSYYFTSRDFVVFLNYDLKDNLEKATKDCIKLFERLRSITNGTNIRICSNNCDYFVDGVEFSYTGFITNLTFTPYTEKHRNQIVQLIESVVFVYRDPINKSRVRLKNLTEKRLERIRSVPFEHPFTNITYFQFKNKFIYGINNILKRITVEPIYRTKNSNDSFVIALYDFINYFREKFKEFYFVVRSIDGFIYNIKPDDYDHRIPINKFTLLKVDDDQFNNENELTCRIVDFKQQQLKRRADYFYGKEISFGDGFWYTFTEDRLDIHLPYNVLFEREKAVRDCIKIIQYDLDLFIGIKILVHSNNKFFHPGRILFNHKDEIESLVLYLGPNDRIDLHEPLMYYNGVEKNKIYLLDPKVYDIYYPDKQEHDQDYNKYITAVKEKSVVVEGAVYSFSYFYRCYVGNKKIIIKPRREHDIVTKNVLLKIWGFLNYFKEQYDQYTIIINPIGDKIYSIKDTKFDENGNLFGYTLFEVDSVDYINPIELKVTKEENKSEKLS